MDAFQDMSLNQAHRRFTKRLGWGLLGTVVFLTGCSLFNPPPPEPKSVNEWLSQTKRIGPWDTEAKR